MLWEQMWSFFKSWFIYQNVEWDLMLIGIGLAIVFGAIWLLGHWPPLFKKPWFWVAAVVSAFLTLLAVVFVQIPLQYYIGQALGHFWSSNTLTDWLLLAGIPTILVTGLVQEGAKMVPLVFWWWRSGRRIDPKLGMAIGAIAGAGFGIFEAVWGHLHILGAGWTPEMVSLYGFVGLSPLWERFFTLGFHIAVSALVGYGLARGKGWQFYLIAAALHTLFNYSTIVWGYAVMVRQSTAITVTHIEIFIAAVAVLVTIAVLLLRWRKEGGEPRLLPVEPIMPVGTDKPAGSGL